MSQNSQKAAELPILTLHRGLDYAVIMRPDETTDDALVQALHPNDDDIAVMTAMAAAPELLAALKRLSAVAVWDDDTDRAEFDAAMADAEAALAKAGAA